GFGLDRLGRCLKRWHRRYPQVQLRTRSRCRRARPSRMRSPPRQNLHPGPSRSARSVGVTSRGHSCGRGRIAAAGTLEAIGPTRAARRASGGTFSGPVAHAGHDSGRARKATPTSFEVFVSAPAPSRHSGDRKRTGCRIIYSQRGRGRPPGATYSRKLRASSAAAKGILVQIERTAGRAAPAFVKLTEPPLPRVAGQRKAHQGAARRRGPRLERAQEGGSTALRIDGKRQRRTPIKPRAERRAVKRTAPPEAALCGRTVGAGSQAGRSEAALEISRRR